MTIVSEVRIEQAGGADRAAHLPAETEPVVYGLHGEIAAHYQRPEGSFTPHASTIDHLVAAVAGCLAGTFAGALAARKISPKGIRTVARGTIENEGGTLVVKRIDVVYEGLEVPDDKRDVVERVLAVHADGCPVARSVKGSIDITTSLG